MDWFDNLLSTVESVSYYAVDAVTQQPVLTTNEYPNNPNAITTDKTPVNPQLNTQVSSVKTFFEGLSPEQKLGLGAAALLTIYLIAK